MRAMVSLVVGALLVLCAGQGTGQETHLRAQVATAVARDLSVSVPGSSAPVGMQVLGAQVRVPEQASLRVAAVHAVPGANTWLLRMECGSRRECLPFEVALRGRNRDAAAGVGSGSTPSYPVGDNRIGAPLVRAGQRVQLAEEVSGMYLSTAAVCLEAGSLGQRIRVRNVASRRIVLARVRAAGQVMVED